MKHLALLFSLALISLGASGCHDAHAGSPATGIAFVEQLNVSTTGSAPTAVTDGFSLVGVKGIRVMVCAHNANATLSGAGSLQAYAYSYDAAANVSINSANGNGWGRNTDSGGDKTITVTATSCAGSPCSCEVFNDTNTTTKTGRATWVPNGITVSAGTTVDLYYSIWKE